MNNKSQRNAIICRMEGEGLVKKERPNSSSGLE
jgi:hypothetical protein